MEPLTSVSGAVVAGFVGLVPGGEAVDAHDRRRFTASGVDADDRSESSPPDDSADLDISFADISIRLHALR